MRFLSLIAAGLIAACATPAEQSPPAQMPSAIPQLPNSSWAAEDIDGGGIIDRSRVTLSFDASDRVAGTAGCNRFFGQYQVDGAKLQIGALGSTKMACAPALMTQEDRYLKLLGAVTTYAVRSDGALVLTTADGRELRFRSDVE